MEFDRYQGCQDILMREARADVIYDYVGLTGKPTPEEMRTGVDMQRIKRAKRMPLRIQLLSG